MANGEIITESTGDGGNGRGLHKFQHEVVEKAPAGEVEGARTRVKIDGVGKAAGDVNAADTIHSYLPAIIKITAAEAPRPGEVARAVELCDGNVEEACT